MADQEKPVTIDLNKLEELVKERTNKEIGRHIALWASIIGLTTLGALLSFVAGTVVYIVVFLNDSIEKAAQEQVVAALAADKLQTDLENARKAALANALSDLTEAAKLEERLEQQLVTITKANADAGSMLHTSETRLADAAKLEKETTALTLDNAKALLAFVNSPEFKASELPKIRLVENDLNSLKRDSDKHEEQLRDLVKDIGKITYILQDVGKRPQSRQQP